VDDEPQILDGLQRSLFDSFDVHVATSGPAALELLQQSDKRAAAFEVIVSDMRMPEMNGAQLLACARDLAPDTTRVLLTGHTDMDSAIAAVNEGEIFRFLSKPCAPETLVAALSAAVRQHRLLRAEKELLEQTLVGTVRLMTDVLELAAPAAFARTSHVRSIVSHVARTLRLEHAWIYESAAALCQIGCVALPSELLERVSAGQELNAEDRKSYAEHPEVAYRLVAKIPRLQPVAEIVRRQHLGSQADASADERIMLGGELLHLALELDKLISRGLSTPLALMELRKAGLPVRPSLMYALRSFAGAGEREVVRAIQVRELAPGMIFDEEVRARHGALLVGKNRTADPVTIERLKRFAAGIGVIEPFRVRVTLAD
jgi:response regulator RpfG family c-di-GMP phosphodiesterase